MGSTPAGRLLGAFVCLICVAFACQTVSPPVDWQGAVKAGDALFSACPPPAEYCPHVGNGFLAYKLGPNMNGTSPGATMMGGLHMAGVFNGRSNVTPAHRAHIPAVQNVHILSSGDTKVAPVGASVFLRHGITYNRSVIESSMCPGHTVQLAWYAHRMYRSLSVLVVSGVGFKPGDSCTVELGSWAIDFSNSPDFNFTARSSSPQSQAMFGVTLLAEIPSVKATSVGLAFHTIPRTVTLNASSSSSRFLLVGHSSLDTKTPVEDAKADLLKYEAMTMEALQASHIAAWQRVWSSGVEIDGNATTAAALNSSLYYILSSIRQDWPLGTSPGGLSIDSYNGHSFWDTETWMFPNVLLLNPALAKSLLQYRLDRLPAALQRAKNYGFKGAMFPWESALTGFDCVVYPPNLEGRYEQHITGDIVMAFRQYFYATNDTTWLREAWPLISAGCAFFESRFEVTNSSHGNYTILNVQPPDESAGVVNSSAYTNAVGAASLLFCVEAAAVLDIQVPSAWASMAHSVYLPVVTGLFDGGPVHPEYAGFNGEQINQADVALLQYPLLWPMPEIVAKNDLNYYIPLTPLNGFYTGDSVYSIAWLAIGSRVDADAQWGRAFVHMDLEHFNVWKERANGKGHKNFITGAGGFLQNLMNGYGGVRLLRSSLTLNPLLPPATTGMRIRKLRYRGYTFSVGSDGSNTTLQLDVGGPSQSAAEQSGLCVKEVRSGRVQPLGAQPVVLAAGKLEVFTCGLFPKG